MCLGIYRRYNALYAPTQPNLEICSRMPREIRLFVLGALYRFGHITGSYSRQKPNHFLVHPLIGYGNSEFDRSYII